MKAQSVHGVESAILLLVLWTTPPVNVFLFQIWDAPVAQKSKLGFFIGFLFANPGFRVKQNAFSRSFARGTQAF